MAKLHVVEPECPAIKALDRLVEARRRLVQDRVNLSNRISGTLKSYYPHVLE